MIVAARRIYRVLLVDMPTSGLQPAWDGPTRMSLLRGLLERGFSARVVRRPEEIPTDAKETDGKTLAIGVGEPPAFPQTEGLADELLAPEWMDAAQLSVEAILDRVEAAGATPDAPAKRWKPWFPVIDFSRCTNCMQCLSFCLFDVYGVTTEGKITVQNENNCKTDCPACSRVCPEVAIMFPKYKAGPINGEEVQADDIRREAMKVDISALLGGDIYSMLRDRSAKAKSRFSKERDDGRALKERERCLTKLKSQMGDLEIPPELLASLPSADQIQRKAEDARRKAEGALATQAAQAAANNAPEESR